MPNQKLLAEYCIPNLLANVQPIHHAWPNKIQTMDCLLSKIFFWVNLRISMTTISQNHPKNLWTSMDQNHSHMPILYKMVCKKVQLYKVAWSRHFWQPHPLYKLAGPCPSSIKLFARKFSSIKWLDHVISGSPTLCVNWTGPCPSFIKWFARKFSSIKWIDHVISGSTTLCINWTGPCPSSIKWFARKFSSIKWLGWCISWLYKMLCRNFLSIKCPGCSTNSSS